MMMVMLFFGISIGILIVGLFSGRAMKSQLTAKTNEMNEKIMQMSAIVLDVIQNFHNVTTSMKDILKTQDELVQSLIKEKKALQRQLHKSTEAIAELEEHLSGLSDEDEEDKSDNEDSHTSSIKQHSIANDKLITIQALLEDSVKKGESVDPNSLLGIVKFKK